METLLRGFLTLLVALAVLAGVCGNDEGPAYDPSTEPEGGIIAVR